MERKYLLAYIEEIKNFYKVDENLLKKNVKTKDLEEFLFNFLKNDFLDILKQDKKAYDLYYRLTWEREHSYLSFYFKNDMLKHVGSKSILKGKYCFIDVDTLFSFNEISIKDEFKNIFKKILLEPKYCKLIDFDVKANFTYKNEYILDDFKEALAYKNNNIKRFYSKLNIKEFFEKSNYARRFLAAAVNSYERKRVDKENLKKFILNILKDNVDTNIENILINRKKIDIYPSRITGIIGHFLIPLKKILRELDNEFLSIENIIGFIKCSYGFREVSPGGLENYGFSSNKEFEEKVIIPILKGYIFFLAALGVVEIAFDKSDFNSLRGVRITEFGKFIFDKLEDFEFREKEKLKEKIIYSDIKPLIKLQNPTAKTLAKLEKFALKTGEWYLLDNKKFLNCDKECIREKIKEFRKTFKNPSKVVEDFIKNIEENLDALKKEDFIVIQIDEKLKNKVLKINKELGDILIPAKGNRILVSYKDYERLKEAFIKEGIYID